jgi:SAM-dependent methyltransferase
MEDAADLIVGHYERHALSWDADRRAAAWIDKPHIERFLSLLPPGATVLDLGCGGGSPVALHMAVLGIRVTGVDSSPTLISLCRTRMPDEEWIVGDMRSLALGRKFDGILAWDSFFHLRHKDQRTMFSIFSVHAAPAAILMFNAGFGHGEAIGSYRSDSLYHASLDASEYKTLLADFGFQLIAHSINAAHLLDRIVEALDEIVDPLIVRHIPKRAIQPFIVFMARYRLGKPERQRSYFRGGHAGTSPRKLASLSIPCLQNLQENI